LIHPELEKLAAPFERTSRIIWGAFVFAPVIYSGLAWLLTQGGERQLGDGQFPADAIYIAVLLALLSGVIFPWVIAPRFIGPARMMQSSDMRPPTFEGEAARIFERLGERDKARARMLGGVQAARIVRWAGAESVAIYGLLALMMGVTDMYGAWAFSIAAIVLLTQLRPDYAGDLDQLDTSA